MSGIPVDLLVDIDGPYDCFTAHPEIFHHNKIDLVSSDPIDDPFEICSISKQINDDIGLELGLALEKSIKLCSQANWQNNKPDVKDTQQSSDLGILVNLDESPDKKLLPHSRNSNQTKCSTKETEYVFNNPSNPFQLAWDVIEQEALNLADHIQCEKPNISPRKMVEMAMWQSPDSPLISPTKHTGSHHTEAPFLIKSSPDLERRCNSKPLKPNNSNKGRSSVASSPTVSKSSTTPFKNRSSVQNSPLRRTNTKIASSPAKTAVPRISFKTPLVRPSVSVPVGCVSTSKTAAAPSAASKAVPMKAIHGVVPHSSSNGRSFKPIVDSPLRRPSTSSTPSRTPQRSSLVSTPSVISRPPLMRAGSDLTQQLLRKTAATLQNQSSARRPSRSSNPSLTQLPGASIHPATPIPPKRNPLSRNDCDAVRPPKFEIPTVQRQGSRSGSMKRVSFSNTPAATYSATTACTTAPSGSLASGNTFQKLPPIKSALQRAKPRCKENQEPLINFN